MSTTEIKEFEDKKENSSENSIIEEEASKSHPNKIEKNPKRGRVFVRNLSFKNISEEKIKSLFSKYGEITEVNLPKNETGEMKGFGFIQFVTKRDALNAIKEMNNKKMDGRKIQVSLAVSKEDYKKVEGEEKIKEREKRKENKIKNKKMNEKKEKTETPAAPKRPLLNDPARTIFIRNLGFSTDEESLKNFFNSFQGNVLYAKICKDPQTKTSKGTGFVMFKDESDVENVLSLYSKYNNRDRNEETSSLNPFELEGRNLKLFPALSKSDADKMVTENKKEKDKRNRHLLYFGLSPSSLAKHIPEENREISEEDQEKRENLIKIKKSNFNKNPNYHVSETRLSLRNFDKTVNEDLLKKIISKHIIGILGKMSPEDMKIYKYDKIKKIKQIKILRDKNIVGKDDLPKSKCVAFIEVCDLNLAKELVHSLSNIKLNKKKPKKGLIVDFALDDSRKLNAMKKKKERIRERNKQKHEEGGDGERNDQEVKPKKEKVRKNSDGENTIKDINDINALLDIYAKTVSRGKKQRVKQKLRALGYDKPLEGLSVNIKTGSLKNENSAFLAADQFVTTKIETNKTNLNKKIKENRKKEKKGETGTGINDSDKKTNLLKNKRKRDEKGNASKLNYREEIYSDDSGNEDDSMNPYYAQIMENLNKQKSRK